MGGGAVIVVVALSGTKRKLFLPNLANVITYISITDFKFLKRQTGGFK